MRKRLLIFARDTYPPFRVDITQLFSRYVARDFDLDWIMKKADGSARGIVAQDNERFLVADGSSELIVIAGKALFQRNGPKPGYAVIQCRDILIGSALICLVCRLRGIPFVYWMSYPMDLGYIEIARRNWSEGRVVRAASRWMIGRLARFLLFTLTLPLSTHVFAQSRQMKADLCAAGINADKITAVPWGFDLERFSRDLVTPANDPLYISSKVIVYVGTLDLSRRLVIPMEGVARHIASNPGTAMLIIGAHSREERDVIRSIFRKHGLESSLHFRDQMPLSDVLGHVRRAAVCLSPYPADTVALRAGTPTKLVEYLAMGARVVANRHPDQTEIAEATGTPVICDYTPEGFQAAIAEAFRLGPLQQVEIEKGIAWLHGNRDYRNLSECVNAIYRHITMRSAAVV